MRLRPSPNRRLSYSTKRLEGGLTKLVEAAEAVDRMQIELTDKKVIVDAKTKDVEALIIDIEAKTKVANVQQIEASEKQVAANAQSEIIEVEKAKAAEALMEALPAVAAASEALANLDKKSLDEIKAFAKPPALVQSVCMMVICLAPTGEKLQESWGDAKKMLSNTKLLDLLKNYPKDSISAKQITRVKAYFKNPDMTVENMTKVSTAGKGLLTWVVAISKYYDVAKNVEPLKAKVKAMEKEASKTSKELEELNTMLAALQVELDALNKNYSAANSELKIGRAHV